MNFQTFFSESFKDLPEETLSQIHQFSRKLSQIQEPPAKKTSLGSISVVNRETNRVKNIPLVLSPENISAVGEWTGKQIVLYWKGIQNLNAANLEKFLVHEVWHGVQHYKDTSETYDDAITTIRAGGLAHRKDYFLEPAEFEAHLGTLRFHLINHLKRVRTSTLEVQRSDVQWSKQKTLFLTDLEQFIRTPLKRTIRNLPKWIIDDKNFLVACLESPKHLKLLKSRLFQVWSELSNLS